MMKIQAHGDFLKADPAGRAAVEPDIPLSDQ
jgi:hypothetical protein